MSPMVFRLNMADILEEVSAEWAWLNCGLLVSRERLQYVCWAGDTWLFAKSIAELSYVHGMRARGCCRANVSGHVSTGEGNTYHCSDRR